MRNRSRFFYGCTTTQLLATYPGVPDTGPKVLGMPCRSGFTSLASFTTAPA